MTRRPQKSNSFPAISRGRPAVLLAPMEGVTDGPMREFMTSLGGFTYCVAEFLRISQESQSAKCFQNHVPELLSEGKTRAGTHVQVQILGGHSERVAESAFNAYTAGANAIDLNFGCPANTVNRHDGGATLLKYPIRIRSMVEAVRKAVPISVPVSAKIRLGWDSIEPVFENAEMAASGGASWITIHARTRMQGYNPPVFWQSIGDVRMRLGIPVVANGDIFTFEDFLRCRDESGCEHFMLGRGALSDPSLARKISKHLGINEESVNAFEQGREMHLKDDRIHNFESVESWLPVLRDFAKICFSQGLSDGYVTRRTKQWLTMRRKQFGLPWFDHIKTASEFSEILRAMESF